ncbi:pilin [Patescibacteria group bacterium]|nr:pilin [Patescibacteria group bacterium]MBU1895347.1 pilin [Patescibacteria group bacterium]
MKLQNKIIITCILAVLFFPLLAVAQDAPITEASISTRVIEASAGLNPLIGEKSVPEIIGGVIKTLTGILGTIALIMIIYGGVMWMTSGGSGEKDKKALLIMVWAALGVFLILASYIVVSFVFEGFNPNPATTPIETPAQ